MEENGAKKHRGTFIVEVCCRENASWQGKVTWADKGRSQHFRSALELLKMMDQALERLAVLWHRNLRKRFFR